MTRSARGTRILGVTANFHDSSVALLENGKFSAYAEEDRLSGIKHTGRFPELALEAVLGQCQLDPSRIDHVAYHMSTSRYLAGAARATRACLWPSPTSRRRLLHANSLYKRVYRHFGHLRTLERRFPNAKIVTIAHHVTHAAHAFLSSGFDRAAVLVLDSIGEYSSGGIFRFDTEGWEELRVWHEPHSLGLVYGALTEHLGFKRNDEEGTVMALAALGDPARFRSVLAQGLALTAGGFAVSEALFPPRVHGPKMPRVSTSFIERVFPKRHATDPLDQAHMDLAASLQERTEQTMCHLAEIARRVTGETSLCLAGGVAQNCVGAATLAEQNAFSEVFTPSAPNDSGNSLGAAAVLCQRQENHWPTQFPRSPYIGPCFGLAEIDTAVAAAGLQATVLDDPLEVLVHKLAEGQIIGLFQGAIEAGPRALGHRSILASPLRDNVVSDLNRKIKYREDYRPFAPMLRLEDATRWFEPTPADTRFMSYALRAKAGSDLPRAIVHDNGRARVQTIDREQSPKLHHLLTRFGQLTGVPILINTSLNVKGCPVAGTPALAIECLLASGMDGLLLEDRFIANPAASKTA